jgi:hypothetical protein
MTNIELVLTLFSAAAVLSVAATVAAAFWSHSRSTAREQLEAQQSILGD